MSDVAAIIAQIQAGFKEKASEARPLDGKRIQFELTGEGGNTYLFDVQGDTLNVTEGGAVSPDLAITVSKDDFVALVGGKLGAMQAFMTGKIKMKGDMGLAMKLQALLG